ncbi:DUF222 domain-containing protein [Microbacterium sp. 22296]|uniref:DUF222 domain-containing protein n=1 Tax=Microbacterium sp. 22296 TaxID=3453903 RepID=UPI003F872A1C
MTDTESDAEWAAEGAMPGEPGSLPSPALYGAPESTPIDAHAAARSDLDARLGHLELTVAARHRAAAEEGRAIAALSRDAAADPTPWVGPDPTLDLTWNDARGRTVAAVRRDRADLAERAAVAEIAVRLRLSEQTVRTRAAQVEVLQQRCPVLWRQVAAGSTSDRHATDAARLAASLPHDDPASWAAFDAGVARLAPVLVPAKFAVAARALRERVHAETIDTRHRRAARDRGVWMTPELDGMASLSALLPADRARSLMSRLDRAARHLHAAPDEERTLAQLRADVLADLVASPPVESIDAAGSSAQVPTPADDAADAASSSPHPVTRSRRNGSRPSTGEPDATARPPRHARARRDDAPPTTGEPDATASTPSGAFLPRGDSGPTTRAKPPTPSSPTGTHPDTRSLPASTHPPPAKQPSNRAGAPNPPATPTSDEHPRRTRGPPETDTSHLARHVEGDRTRRVTGSELWFVESPSQRSRPCRATFPATLPASPGSLRRPMTVAPMSLFSLKR